jgi:hypothetical protein
MFKFEGTVRSLKDNTIAYNTIGPNTVISSAIEYTIFDVTNSLRHDQLITDMVNNGVNLILR